jgi:hypothetical protein
VTLLRLRRSLIRAGACLVIVAAVITGLTLARGWMVDQGASSVRVDVLGRERSLVALSLADLERIVGEGDRTATPLLERHLRLLVSRVVDSLEI